VPTSRERRAILPDDVIEALYEAAVFPGRWPHVLDLIARHVRAAGGGLYAPGSAGRAARWTATPRLSDLTAEAVSTGWAQRSSRVRASLNHQAKRGFITDLDLFDEDTLDIDPLYTEFLRPRGFGWIAMSWVFIQQSESIIINFERQFEEGPFGRYDIGLLDALAGHIARASLLTLRAGQQALESPLQTLDALDFAAATISLDGRLRRANGAFRRLIGSALTEGRDRLHLSSLEGDRLFAEKLQALAFANARNAATFPAPATRHAPPCIIHLMPLIGDARDLFGGNVALMVATPVQPQGRLPSELLQQLFSLSPAEARVAQMISAGHDVGAAAAGLGVSRETVRTQLRAVLAKTHTSRQAELTALLSAIRSPTQPDRI
jgi:DNA-binding CsgD family transcriptional regulator